MDVVHVLLFSLGLYCCFGQELPPSLDVTRLEPEDPGCRADIEALRQGLDTGQLWAQTMWDAGVKSPVGLLSQTEVQFGDFDECLTLRSPVTPQFCLMDISPHNANISSWLPFKWGMCLPATCSAPELTVSLQRHLGERVEVNVMPEACTTRETASRSLTHTDVIYCLVVICAVVVVCLATTYDMIQKPDYDGVSPPQSLCQCLSARHGWYSLVRSEQPISGINLSALYGLHASAFFFIIMGHRFGASFIFMTVTNYRSVQKMFVGSWYSIWFGHMDLFVDIFFFMSAFLVSLLYYAELHKRYINPFLVYLFRLCRIIPAYAVVVFFYATLLRQLGDGPLWNIFMDVEQSNCKNYWWTNLLFINTYVEQKHMCLLQSWYISCDFQLFVGATLLVFLLHQYPRPGIVVAVFLFVLSTIAPFFGTYFYNRPALLLFYRDFWNNPRTHDFFNTIYSQGHYRGTSYLPGILAGCYVYNHRKEPLTKNQTYLLQTVGMVICFLTYWSGALFYDMSNPPSQLVNALYASFFHSVFGFGLALNIITYTLGQPTWLTQVYSWKGFVPLSKLSFCVYLIHNIPHFVWLASSRAPNTLSFHQLVSWSIADLFFSLIVALVLFLAIETPMRYLIKFLVTGKPPSTTRQQNTEPQERYIIQDTYNFQKA